MIDATRRSNGFPVSRVTSNKEAYAPQQTPKDTKVSEAAAGATQALSNNPSLRALRGESGFDGVQSQDKSAKISGQSNKDQMEQLYRSMILGSIKRRSDDDSDLDGLKRRIASLMIALGKDDPLPKSGGHSKLKKNAAAPSQSAAATKAASNSTRPTEDKKGTGPTQPVQPQTGEIPPLEKVLEVLQGILKALEDAKGASA